MNFIHFLTPYNHKTIVCFYLGQFFTGDGLYPGWLLPGLMERGV